MQQHITSLQSFRGIAALIVLIHHCMFYFNYDSQIKSWTEFFFNAHAAVVAFYVLSGYVLTLSLMKKEISFPSITEFYIRRGFRIYPAFWVAAMISLLYLIIFRDTSKSVLVSEWWSVNHNDNYISWSKVFINFIGFGTELPLPTWSISLEIIASILLPFLIIFLKKSEKLFIILTFFLGYISLNSGGILNIYMFYFALGSSITLWGKYLNSMNKKILLVIGLISICFIFFGRQIGGWNYTNYYHSPYAALIEGLSSSILISIIATHPNIFNILKNKILVYLGDISYSIYLLHLPIMAFIAILLEKMALLQYITNNGLILSLLLLLLTTILTIVFSDFLYKRVELNGIKYGKFIIRIINRKTPL
ncbi:acyltransferase [Acinetobacter schindleri]|nr:acyltransferase [Acinetobacter schindleri]